MLSGCAALPNRESLQLSITSAIDVDSTTSLGTTAKAAVFRSGFPSAFKFLPLATEAFDTRLELAAQAQRTIDLQTFMFYGDTSGSILLKTLRQAADRGVRVRLLVDDLNSDSSESLLSDVASFDGVEVRLVNPFVRLRGSRTAKLFSSVDEISRINHRMHNKAFVADNAFAILGGRNVGDAYFSDVAPEGTFIDLDVLAAGGVVGSLSASFDAYWNSEFAWPIDSIVEPGGDQATRRARFERAMAAVQLPASSRGGR